MTGLFPAIDWAVVGIANLTNLLLAVMFLLRGRGQTKAGFRVGLASLGLGIPLLAAVGFNLALQRAWWTTVLPGLLLVYDALEFLLDYLLKFDFRHSRWLGPYLGLYYLALMGMIGYCFLVGKPFGFLSLVTYFINLAATAYSYSRVEHG
ncbi:MAG TPA: hypothetical protein VMC09_01565 [Anaerolineales bacterium]|nr:hypothetical protein [Anaerolineales bacterium]